MTYKIAHISDLHFYAHPTFKQLLSKRSLGYLNVILRRAKQYPVKRAVELVNNLLKTDLDHLIITGDFSMLALEDEFNKALKILAPLLADPYKVSYLPGNHDVYVAEASELFYEKFNFVKNADQPVFKKLTNDLHLILLDAAHPNPWFVASGTISYKAMEAAEKYMQNLSNKSKKTKFIVGCHYPLWFPKDKKFDRAHELYNFKFAQNWLYKQPNVIAYLHGHVHHNWKHKLNLSSHEIWMINSASSTNLTNNAKGRSDYHTLIFTKGDLKVEAVSY